MERRSFVISMITFTAAGGFLVFPATGCKREPPEDPLVSEFLPEELLLLIGKSYQELHPDFRGNKEIQKADSVELVTMVDADFDADRTIIVNGWVLAETEAQYCAILYQQNN